MSEFGAEIKRLRTQKGWSQAQLAVYSETSQPTVNQIETGKRNPSAETLVKLARALGVEVVDLFPKGQAPLPLEPVPPERGYAFMASQFEDWRYLFEQAAEQWSREANSGNLFGSRGGALSYSIATNMQAAQFSEIIGERLLPTVEELPEDLAQHERQKLLEVWTKLQESAEAVNAATLAAIPELANEREFTEVELAMIDEVARDFKALPELEQRRRIREVEEVLERNSAAVRSWAAELRRRGSA